MFDISILTEGSTIPESDFALFLAKKGIYKRHKNMLGVGVAPISKEFQKDLDLGPLGAKLTNALDEALVSKMVLSSLGIAPMAPITLNLVDVEPSFNPSFKRIPGELWMKVVEFYTLVFDKFESEAAVLLLYNPDTQEWDVLTPKQTVTGAHATYNLDQAAMEDPRLSSGGYNIVGTSHSHGSMPAFWSGTDDQDELKFDGIHITVGKVNSKPTYAASIVFAGLRFETKISDLVDMPEPAEINPEMAAWMSQVAKPTPPAKLDLAKLPEVFEGQKVTYQGAQQHLFPKFHSDYVWDSDLKVYVLRAWLTHATALAQAAKTLPFVPMCAPDDGGWSAFVESEWGGFPGTVADALEGIDQGALADQAGIA